MPTAHKSSSETEPSVQRLEKGGKKTCFGGKEGVLKVVSAEKMFTWQERKEGKC